MSNWHPIATAPKDGTLLDLWVWRPQSVGFVSPQIRWGSAADRNPKKYGPNGPWRHLGQTGWYDDFAFDCSSIYTNDQFSHWRLSCSDVDRPTDEQLARHRLMAKLSGINIPEY